MCCDWCVMRTREVGNVCRGDQLECVYTVRGWDILDSIR